MIYMRLIKSLRDESTNSKLWNSFIKKSNHFIDWYKYMRNAISIYETFTSKIVDQFVVNITGARVFAFNLVQQKLF